MKSTDSITKELTYYHIKSLKVFSLMLSTGTLLFALANVFFLSAGIQLLIILGPFMIAVFLNAMLATKMEQGGKIGYNIILWLSWGAVMGVSLVTGGLYSSYIYVMLLILTSSYLFSRKLGNMWTALIMLSFALFYLIDYNGWTPVNIIPANQYKYFQLLTFFYLLYLFAVLAVFFQRSAAKARNSRKVIREQNSVIQWKNQQMLDNVRYAGRIQNSILVKTSFLETTFKEHALFYQPKDHVGGDFYWVRQMDNGKVIWAVADCTGHGVSGALMTMIGVSLLNDIVMEQKKECPKVILESLNEGFLRDLNQDNAKSGMNIGICTLDLSTRVMEYAGAKIELQILRDKELINLVPVMKSIGYNYHKARSFEFKKERLILKESDVLYMFSDGYADQFGGPQKQKYYSQNLKKMLLKNSQKSMREQELVLSREFEKWKSGFNEQIDDVLVMGIRI